MSLSFQALSKYLDDSVSDLDDFMDMSAQLSIDCDGTAQEQLTGASDDFKSRLMASQHANYVIITSQ